MNRIERQVDRIIAGLKLIDGLRQIRFVREYGSRAAEAPVRGFLAVVSVTDMSASKSFIGEYLSQGVKGELFCAKAEIRVYAPADENGSGLSELVGELMAGLKRADTEKVITSTGATSIEFDPDMNAVFRTVTLELEFCLCEEV